MSAVAEKFDAPPLPRGFRVCRACGVAFDFKVRDERGVIVYSDPTLNCPAHRGLRVSKSSDGLDSITRYEDDVHAQAFVEEHVDGGTLEEVAVALNVTRERIRQIEGVALVKLCARLKLAGVSREDIRDYFASRAEVTTRRAPSGPYRQRQQPQRVVAVVVVPEPAESPEVLWAMEMLDHAALLGWVVCLAGEGSDGS